jgi:uncharacterized membrane protein
MPRKFYKQASPEENCTSALRNLISCLGINVTSNAIQAVAQDANYPSLKAISDSLDEWGCENLGVNISIDQLHEIPYPAIAHLSKNKGHFVVLTGLDNHGQITYIDPESGWITKSVNDFAKNWTGVALLVQKNERSGQLNYKIEHKEELFRKTSNFVALAILAAVFFMPFFVAQEFSSLGQHIINGIGLVLSFLLFQKQFGIGAKKTLDEICRLGKANCDAVINSPGAKLFGVLNLSEVGFLYFLGGVLFQTVGTISGVATAGISLAVSSFAILLTVVTIYYQAFVIKNWCTLCLGLTVVIWLEFAFSLSIWSGFNLNQAMLFVFFISYGLPLSAWALLRPYFIDSLKVKKLTKDAQKFTRNGQIFKTLLAEQPYVDAQRFTLEFSKGNPEAPLQITVVTNPDCPPCALAYFTISDLLIRYNNDLAVTYRFLVDPKNADSTSYKVARRLVSLVATSSPQIVEKAISEWFSTLGRSDLSKWEASNPVLNTVDPKEVERILQAHYDWCITNNVVATPTIFINGRKMPSEFSISDFSYHVKPLLETTRQTIAS